MQDRWWTQLCRQNKLDCAHCQFSTFWEHQKSGSHPFKNTSFVFQQKSDIVTPWGSLQLANSGPFSPIFIADTWRLSLLANCSAPQWEHFLFISNSTTHSYWLVKPARLIEGSNRLLAHGNTLWRWLQWSCHFCRESTCTLPTGQQSMGKPWPTAEPSRRLCSHTWNNISTHTTGEVWDGWNVYLAGRWKCALRSQKIACDLFPFLEGRGGGRVCKALSK